MTQRTKVGSSINLLKTSTRIARKCWVLAVFSSVAVFPVTAVIATQSALAVSVNQALRLYGNAVNTGLCKTLSPATQNLWVCELTDSDPDVHLTFNADTPLHITVRTPRGTPTCEGNATINGSWPLDLSLSSNDPICNVNVRDYVDRLNSVQDEIHLCIDAFNEAQARGRISPSVADSYIQICRDYPNIEDGIGAGN